MLFKKKEFLVRIGADAMQIAWQTSRNKHYAAFGLLFQINCVGPNKFSLHNLNNNCALAKESLSTDNNKKREEEWLPSIRHQRYNIYHPTIHHHLSPIAFRGPLE